MRYAVLSDIHANAAALRAVLDAVRKEGIEHLVLLGDFIGYYYEPAQVIAELRGWPHVAIRGNHDRLLLEARSDPQILADYRLRYGAGLDQALEDLSAADWTWLAGLPERTPVRLGRFDIDLCHGSPADPDGYVYPDAGEARLDQVAEGSGCDAVWMGHTHWPFLRPGKPWLLNPGSVGQPRDIGGLASWCVFDADSGAVAFRRTEFPVEALAGEAIRRDPHLPRNREVLGRRRLKGSA